MVFGATTYRRFVQMLGPGTEETGVGDPWLTRMRSMPATVVSSTLEAPISTGRTRPSRGATPSLSSAGSRRSRRCRRDRTAVCR